MQDSVTVEITFPYWTEYRATLQISTRSPMTIAFSLVFPIIGLVLIYFWVRGHHSMTLSDMLILLVCFAFMPIITAVNLYLARRRNPLCIGPFKYVFDQFGVHASSVAFENTIRWAALLKVIESGEFILYYIASSNAVAIPKPQLIAAGALDTVRDITRSNFPAFKG